MYSKGILQGIHKYVSENHMKYNRSILEAFHDAFYGTFYMVLCIV